MAVLTFQDGITSDNLHAVYSDSYIIGAISHSDEAPNPIFHELANYLSVFINGEFYGAILLIHYSAFETEIHSLLMKKSAPFSRLICKKLINYCFKESDRVLRISGFVGENLHSVKNLLIKCGFKYEGFRRDAYMKNNEIEGLHIFGITRKEWSEMK